MDGPSKMPIINWFEAPIKQSIKSVFDGINEAVEVKDIFNKYKKTQFRSLKQRMSRVKILGMSAPIKLSSIYYPTHISTTIFRRLYERDWHKLGDNGDVKIHPAPNEAKPSIRADKFIEEKKHVVVLGGPGVGKTTLLRFLAYAYCDKSTFKKSGLKTSRFPVFINLPELSKKKISLEVFAFDQLISKTDKYAGPFLDKMFSSGNAVVLLDSLDEVPSEHKSEILQKIRFFYEQYPLCSVIVSCRTADYIETIDDFYEVEIVKLSQEAVTVIVKAWFGPSGASNANKLLRYLNNDSAISSLTETPLLLSLLCIQYKHDLSIPKRKAELYLRCIDTLMRDWDAGRGFRRESAFENLSDDRKERLFEFIAFHFFQYSPRYTFPEKNVLAKVEEYVERFEIKKKEVKGMLAEIESHHGILEKISMDSYSFSHPSFQEYFTARAILSRRTDFDIIKKYYENEEWNSVIEFIVALREDPEELIEYMLKKSTVGGLKTYPAMARRIMNVRLLYKCLTVGPSISSELYKKCFRHIISSQAEMSLIYRAGGVVPYAVLMSDGVRHSYYYWRKRPTLYNALQPLRMLANIIYAMPLERYADLALDAAEEIIDKKGELFVNASLALNLIVPLTSVAPQRVVQVLEALRKWAASERDGKYFVTAIDESFLYLGEY